MGNEGMKRCSTSLIVKEMPIKSPTRYHFTPIMVATIKKRENNPGHWGCREIETLVHYWWECKTVLLWKAVWRLLTKLKTELSYDPAISLLGMYLKVTKSLSWRGICIPTFLETLFIIVKIRKQLKCLWMDEWIKKM